MELSIQDLGNIGELVAAIATVATLIYLAVQLKQSTGLAQATAQRDLMNSFQANLDRVRSAPEIWHRGLNDFDQLSSVEKTEFQMMFNPFVNHLEQPLRMYERNLETKDNVDVYGDICLSILQEPGAMQLWESTKDIFFPLSRVYIENRLANPDTLPPKVSTLWPWIVVDDA